MSRCWKGRARTQLAVLEFGVDRAIRRRTTHAAQDPHPGRPRFFVARKNRAIRADRRRGDICESGRPAAPAPPNTELNPRAGCLAAHSPLSTFREQVKPDFIHSVKREVQLELIL
jgi:hypothetical protein